MHSSASSADLITRRVDLMPAGPTAAAILLQPILDDAAGDDVQPLSLTLDYGAPVPMGCEVALEAWVDRSTRTLIFAHARLHGPDGKVAVSASAVFRRVGGVPTPAENRA